MLKAILSDKNITIKDKGKILLSCSPIQLADNIKLRIWPFKMMIEKIGNWKEVQEWIAKTIGWLIVYPQKGILDVNQELSKIEEFQRKTQGPTRTVMDNEILFQV